MASDSAPPDRPGRADGGSPAEQSEEGGQPERFGPLLVARHRKDDGRSLILYTREQPRS
jgi:hypothetical protein